MTIPPEIMAALTALALTVIGAIGALVKVLTDRLAKQLDHNTTITAEARDAANGRLAAAQEESARLRQQLQTASARAEILADIVRYVRSRPETAPVIAAYVERRRSRVYDADVERLIEGEGAS